MASLIISNLFADGDFYHELTAEELKTNIIRGAVSSGSISAGRYYEKGGRVQEEALTAAVASSDRQSRVRLAYSFKPRLSVAAWVD